MSAIETGYRHSKERANNPTAEMVKTSGAERKKPKRHALDVKEKSGRLIPTLDWNRAAEHMTVWAPILATQERIEPAEWMKSLSNRVEQLDLFASFDQYRSPERAMWEWYEHRGDWQNRLIHADAIRAMSSLLEHEHFAGAVQCVFMDPPYGMDFDARYMDDTLSVNAFRDTYENGIHSYLDQLRSTLILARELLSESGSLFLQIGDVNVHRCAVVLDEVFGPENRVSTITFATTGGGSSTKSISKAGDYLLWYAKNREEMHFQTLYENQDIADWCASQTFATGGDFPDGTSRALKPEEWREPEGNLPDGVRLWRMGPLLSQGGAQGKEQGEPFTYNDIKFAYGLENAQWRVDRLGLESLAKRDRLWTNVKDGTRVASVNQLHVKMYRDEMPGKRITNMWSKTMAARNKRYAVQTAEMPIERCFLMTTRPGDLVLDPTVGSGTSAVVAETWGRRWIGIDASRASIAVARERILVHDYPKPLLIGSKEGFEKEQELRQATGQEPLAERPQGELDPATGIVVERKKYVSAAALAYEEREDKTANRKITWLVDRPVGGKNRGRIASRFTVETELMEVYQNPEELLKPAQAARNVAWQERVIAMLDNAGIKGGGRSHWNVEGLESIAEQSSNGTQAGEITHKAILVDANSGKKRNAVFAIWPEDAKVDISGLHRNVQEALGYVEDKPVLVIVGAEFADGVKASANVGHWAAEVMTVKAGTDLHIKGTQSRAGSDTSLVLVAESAVRIEKIGEDQFRCALTGWNEYDPIAGIHRFEDIGQVGMWMLDTNYDAMQFCARRIHLPKRLRAKENRRVLEGLIGKDRNNVALKAVFGMCSEPFVRPTTGQIAVRIITAGDGVMMGVYPVQ